MATPPKHPKVDKVMGSKILAPLFTRENINTNIASIKAVLAQPGLADYHRHEYEVLLAKWKGMTPCR